MTSKKRILVIDDESSVRETICENLKECGYTVLEAGDGDSGLKVLGGENRPQPARPASKSTPKPAARHRAAKLGRAGR